MHDYCCWLCLKLVVKKITFISCYFLPNCLLVSNLFWILFFYICQSSRWFSYCYLTGSCRTENEKILFFNKIYNSWRHNKSEPLQEPGLVGQFGPNPSSMIKLEVKHEITIRIIRELVIKEQFRYLTLWQVPCPHLLYCPVQSGHSFFYCSNKIWKQSTAQTE